MDQKRTNTNNINERLALNLEYAFNWGVDIKNRVIRITEDIDQDLFSFIDGALTTLESISRKGITIKISSYGGEVHSALSIVARIQESTCRIHTKGYGTIMSAATAILASGDKRSISRLASFMHHESQVIVEGGLDEVKNELRQHDTEEILWNRLMFELTGVPESYWASRGVGKNFYCDADKCLELNIVDDIF